MKPRRLNVKALSNFRSVKSGDNVRLGDVADVLDRTQEFRETLAVSDPITLVEGQDIRAVEGVVVLRNQEKLWQVEVRKTSKGYPVELRDIVVGLVRPERRNIGFMSQSGTNVFASSDGVAIVREKSDLAKEYPIEWIFHVLRTEACRIQFWTESGGTSYGKLNLEQIRNVLLPKPSADEIAKIAGEVRLWSKSVASSSSMFENLWVSNDRVAILNSPLIGL